MTRYCESPGYIWSCFANIWTMIAQLAAIERGVSLDMFIHLYPNAAPIPDWRRP